jgi:alpha-tubulin suppressor-like RCC1 family protein
MVDGVCELSDVSRRPYCASPLPAALGLTLRTLESGTGHACGLGLEGRVYCWGSNSWGKLGDNTNTERLTPVPVASDLRYADLSVGGTSACALRVDGEADCWGPLPYAWYLEEGLAIADSASRPQVPEPVAPGLKFLSVSVGTDVACGLTDDGAAHCWGDHLHGGLGDGRMRDPNNSSDHPRMTPAPVLGERTFRTVVAGYFRACGLTAEGMAYCWGQNDYGQLGDGSTLDRAEPVLVRAAA